MSRSGTLPRISDAALPCLFVAVVAVLLGAFSDTGAAPPEGVLMEGTVTAHRPAMSGYPATAEIRVEAPSGPALCLIGRSAFPGDRRPPPQTRLTVDFLPGGQCRLPPEPESRWGYFGTGIFFALTGGAMLWYRMTE